jgi:hypothetical protein
MEIGFVMVTVAVLRNRVAVADGNVGLVAGVSSMRSFHGLGGIVLPAPLASLIS